MLYRHFLDAGYTIFDLHGITKNGECECDNPNCQAAGKHPKTKHWQYTQPFSDEQLEEMEQDGFFQSGYGVLVTENLLVIDVDARNGGVESYAKLVEAVPEIAGAGLIVETGSGNGSKHLFFKNSASSQALSSKLSDYPGIDFKSSGFVVGAGSNHKSGNKYNVLIGSPSDIGEAPSLLIKLLGRSRTVSLGNDNDMSLDDYVEALNFISPSCDYDTWNSIGMAIHHATGGSKEGLKIYDKWSKSSEKYKKNEPAQKWHSYGKEKNNPITAATLIFIAQQNGYKKSIQHIEAGWEVIKQNEGLCLPVDPFGDLSHIDIRRPPGFVGELTEYINAQCLFPRENIAVLGAFFAAGNILSMRYVFGSSALNLLCFGIAGSSTGKESVLRATMSILHTAGITRAVYGNIKSEQEMIRNLIEHQASFYLIDEVAMLFRKISNASKRGGSSYLEGIVKNIMQIYTKGADFFAIGGDEKRGLVESVQKEIARLNKRADAGENVDEEIKKKLKTIDDFDQGLVNPFISMFGLCNMTDFENIASHDTVINGFVGRCLITQERNNNPAKREAYKPSKSVPQHLKAKLGMMFHGGYSTERRIQQYADREQVPLADGVDAMLHQYDDYIYHLAEYHGNTGQGYQEVTRRSSEIIRKLCAVMGACDGIITQEHVLYAARFSLLDIREKTRIANAASNDRLLSLISRIDGYLSDNPIYESYIINKLKLYFKKDDISKAIALMESDGKVHRDAKRLIKI